MPVPHSFATSDRAFGLLGWVAGAALLVGLSGFATWISPAFGYDHAVIALPAAGLAVVLCAAGTLFAIGVPRLVRSTLIGRSNAAASRHIAFYLMVAAGLAARAILLPSEPMLEDDYQRYLWDGAVTAARLNPYAASPKQAGRAPLGSKLRALALDSGPILERIGHSNLKTIYPPVTQAAFALAHWLKPWSLVAWKPVLFACDLAVLGLLVALLRGIGRDPLWAALYWWNPLVIKELFNSGHMEAVVMAPVLLALLLAVRQRPIAAVTALGVAVGAKVWPVLLLPLLLRPLVGDWRKLFGAVAVFSALTGLWLWPVVAGGLDETSGFVAYASNWQTNSAFFPALQKLTTVAVGVFGLPDAWGNRVPRAALALTTGGLALWLARTPADDAADLIRRAAIIAAALVMLSPAQYPWYAIWFLPFLTILPLRSFLVLSATLPLYYLFFHFNARGHAEVFRTLVIWAIWIPAWIALFFDLKTGMRADTTPVSSGRNLQVQPI